MKMEQRCSHCNQVYHLEPSFYYGALYVSYGLQVALFATIAVAISVLFDDAPTSWYLGGVTIAAVVLFPVIYRLSRSIWIHFFVKYEKDQMVLKTNK